MIEKQAFMGSAGRRVGLVPSISSSRFINFIRGPSIATSQVTDAAARGVSNLLLARRGFPFLLALVFAQTSNRWLDRRSQHPLPSIFCPARKARLATQGSFRVLV
jgi:hypothetical protein